MPIDYVNEVIRLAAVADPSEQPTEQDWQRVEAELGVEFPGTFKLLVSSLGSGEFGCGLGLFNPRASSEYSRLSREMLITHRELILDLEEPAGFAMYPRPGGLVVVASMDRQDFYLRPDATSKLQDQVVWLNVDTEELRELGMSFSRLVHDLYRGLLAEPWAEELRTYFWRDGDEPFFQSWPRPS